MNNSLNNSLRDTALFFPEIKQDEFVKHIDDEDFTQTYGNPVIITSDTGKKYLSIAWPLAERMMRAEGRGDEADAIIKTCAEIEVR